MSGNGRRTLWLFALLAAYIIAQFTWWALLLLRRNAEVSELQGLQQDESIASSAASSIPSRDLMVLSEAFVFLAILLVLLWLTYRALKRDLAHAARQQNFMLAVTHELRTPIASAKLQLQTLERPGLSTAQRDELLRTADSELDRLSSLTGKVLQAAAINETPDQKREQTDAAALVRDTVRTALATYAINHRVEINGPSSCTVMTDAAELRSILENLLENAAKYAPSGSRIDVTLERGEHGWRLLVADEGPGIPADERERVFERFYRIGKEETREQRGTGLGLYIVKRLAQRNGGHVEVRPRDPRGAIFAVAFPST